MAAPGYSLSTSSASSASGESNSGFDNSGFAVNFGGRGGVTTGAMPQWVVIAGVGVMLWLVLRKKL